ncbi:hypothetical protein [Cryobacterium arcticum]|uniref:DUF8175 domain-containing protein n=1 Tax=Cryobacterium arcticum TaxID=670052 RepID=A0A1B1BQH3_9MICO|nr:hypothetical protein [Cryobacterium arcticum]ANP74867.1 hypothetical protein PA27867_3960 [Cryobacterium arcticum]
MSSAEPKSPFRSRGFIAAAIVIGVIVLAAIVVLVGGLFRDDNDTASAPTATTTATPTVDEADVSICGLPGHDTENTLTAAPTNEWELVGTVAAPTDPNGAGPGVVDDGIRSCYSHTAKGALFAVVNYFALASDARNSSALFDLVEPGKGRDAAIAAQAAEPITSAGTRLQVAGFRINSYDGQEAVVDVAWSVTSQGGALVSFPMVMHWAEGDWKIVLTDEGTFPYTSSALTNLGGYLPWAGV